MDKIISYFMAILYSILSFFGIPFESPDLETSPLPEVVLTQEEREFLETFVETERAYIAGNQIENGAIPMTKTADGIVTVNPYFADIAAMALLENAEKYSDAVKKYLDWHFLHLNQFI